MSPTSHRALVGVLTVTIISLPLAARAQQRVVDTVHNLSISGPGETRAETEEQVCIFCHAPHNTGGAKPLWNRDFSISNYRIYRSSTFDAAAGQPTGASKLCLSCHDGTIALGRVLSRAQRIQMSGGDFIPAGLSNLGTDLSDDHPISFQYTAGLAASDGQLKSPSALPPEIELDASSELQCTACHDAHQNKYRKFLTLDDAFGALCKACHDMNGWLSCSHATSGQDLSSVAGQDWAFSTVAENACGNCHRTHAAGGHERLLISRHEEDNCLNCHNGQGARFNIQAELDKPSSHDPRRYLGVHDAVEMLAGTRPHVECSDCHNPHASNPPSDQVGFTAIGATMRGVPGVTLRGSHVREASFEYEVCFRCHGDAPVPISRRITRQAEQSNLRLAFSGTNPSYHPVTAASAGEESVSLDPTIAKATLLRCTDCHNNDRGSRGGGAGPDGPHGSVYDFLLERNYSVRDGASESAYDYALCYKCHLRASILNDESFPTHSLHVRDNNMPCSTCHDAHGINPIASTGSDHTHLINFDLEIVRPLTGTARIEFRDLGRLAGTCTMTCHGSDHDNVEYGN